MMTWPEIIALLSRIVQSQLLENLHRRDALKCLQLFDDSLLVAHNLLM